MLQSYSGCGLFGIWASTRPDHYPQTPMSCCRQTEEQLWQPYISNRMGYTQRTIFPGIYIYKRYRQHGTFE